jgi:hypothetical protein
MSTRMYLSTYPSPITPEEETPVCMRIQRSHATVKDLQSRLQWIFRMLSESSHAPFLGWFSVCASHREPHGVANTMIESVGRACVSLQRFVPVRSLCYGLVGRWLRHVPASVFSNYAKRSHLLAKRAPSA